MQATSEIVTVIASSRGMRALLDARPYEPYPLIGPQEHAPKVNPVVLAVRVPVAVGSGVARLNWELARWTGRTATCPGNDEGTVFRPELSRRESGADTLTDHLLVHRVDARARIIARHHGATIASRSTRSPRLSG